MLAGLALLLVAGWAVIQARPAPDGPGGQSAPLTPPPPAPPEADEEHPLPEPPIIDLDCLPMPAGTSLTVLTFNIHSGIGRNGPDLPGIAEEILAWDADIVMLQEVDERRPRSGGVRQADWLGRATSMAAVYGGRAPMNRDGGLIGNAVLSKYPIMGWRSIDLPMAGGRAARTAVQAVVDVDGVQVSVWSTHLDHHRGSARRAQAAVIAGQVAADRRPTLIGADLNVVPGSAPLRQLLRADLRDAWRAGDGPGLTVPAGAPRRRIDFLLHSREFTAVKAGTLRSSVSDHRAVWARLELGGEGECIQIGDG